MKATNYNNGWKFWKITNSFALNWAPPQEAVVIDLPHDAMIECPQTPDAPAGANTGYRKGGIYSYSKAFTPEDPHRTYILKIEGAYMNAFVYINGALAAKRPMGYTVFYVPMNDYLEFGSENEIRIQVRSGAEPNSRWYPGTGLYRDVYLLESGPVYIQPDMVQIRTISIPETTPEGSAASSVSASAPNAASLSGSYGCAVIRVSASVMGTLPDGKAILQAIIRDSQGNTVAYQDIPVDLEVPASPAQAMTAPQKLVLLGDAVSSAVTASAQIEIPSPKLWCTETPYLYTCSLTLKSAEGVILDTHSDSFGIRTLSLSARAGLKVNGNITKLRGTCIHHDAGMLGAKTYDEVELRRISRLKNAGYNAIRSAHNPASPALLRACDKVGMYVMDETFDMWTRHKSDYDYAMYFNEWWEADTEAMVHNAFNHPSVIMYSIGNEIPEIGTPQGGRISQLLNEKIHSLDDTRFTLASVNGMFSVGEGLGKIVEDTAADLAAQGEFDGNVNDFMSFMHQYMGQMVGHEIVDQVISIPFEHTDIAGYNYMEGRYEMDGPLHPDRVIVGSETGIASIHVNWPLVKRLPYLIGDFSWTGWDYLGEAGIGAVKYSASANPFADTTYPMQTAQTGDFDITGFRLPMSYYREIIFGLRKDPYIAVQDPAHYGEPLIRNPWVISDAVGSWTWSAYEGKPVVVEVYSDSEEVELLKNGISLGRQKAGEGNHFTALFETTYEPGALTAISYSGGTETGRYEISSASGEVSLVITEEVPVTIEIPEEAPNTLADTPEANPADTQSINSYGSTDPGVINLTLSGTYNTGNEAGKETTASESATLSLSSSPTPVLAARMKEEYEKAHQQTKIMTAQLKENYLSGKSSAPFAEQSAVNPMDTTPVEAGSDDIPVVGISADPFAGIPEDIGSYEDPLLRDYSVKYYEIALVDNNGILAADQEAVLKLTLQGEAQLLGFGSADPKPSYNYNEYTAKTWRGRAQLILKVPTDGHGEISILTDTGLHAAAEF